MRAMAMARSLAHLFFLFLVSTASAARNLPGDATTSNNLDEACDETHFPDLCARSLADFPESRTASPRRLAELSVVAALEAGKAAAASAHDALNNVQDEDDDGLLTCLDGCSADVEEAVARLSALSREPTDARFLDVKAWTAPPPGASSST
jgi:pectinesterase inhibitor-like protein